MNIPILVSQRLITNTAYPEVREMLDVRWGRFLSRCRICPIPVPVYASLKDYFSIVRPRGILLTGGNDLSSLASTPLNKLRDGLELKLIQWGLRKKIPIIGVCRGMQMLANYFRCGLKKREGHVGRAHPITLNLTSRFGKFYHHGRVNSFHEYCVTSVSHNIQTAAKSSDDQTIEAMEHRCLPIYGMMWHPERNKTFRSADIRFFKDVYGVSRKVQNL